ITLNRASEPSRSSEQRFRPVTVTRIPEGLLTSLSVRAARSRQVFGSAAKAGAAMSRSARVPLRRRRMVPPREGANSVNRKKDASLGRDEAAGPLGDRVVAAGGGRTGAVAVGALAHDRDAALPGPLSRSLRGVGGAHGLG